AGGAGARRGGGWWGGGGPGVGGGGASRTAGYPPRWSLPARHSGDHNPVRHQRRDDADVTFLVIGKFLFPELFSGLHVERDDVAIERLAKQPTIVNRGSPAHEGAGSPDPRRRPLILNRRAPDRLAGGDIERKSPVAVHDV